MRLNFFLSLLISMRKLSFFSLPSSPSWRARPRAAPCAGPASLPRTSRREGSEKRERKTKKNTNSFGESFAKKTKKEGSDYTKKKNPRPALRKKKGRKKITPSTSRSSFSTPGPSSGTLRSYRGERSSQEGSYLLLRLLLLLYCWSISPRQPPRAPQRSSAVFRRPCASTPPRRPSPS